MRRFVICTEQILLCDQIKTNQMDVSCSKYGETRDGYRILVGKTEEKIDLEEIDVDRRTKLK